MSEKAAELGADVTALITSASSKTALGLAHALSGRDRVTTHGLTSTGNLAFVRGTSLFDAVTTYDTVENASLTSPVILLDFAGNRPVVSAVHERFGDDLALSLIVGGTHTEAFDTPTETARLPGPTPVKPDSGACSFAFVGGGLPLTGDDAALYDSTCGKPPMSVE